MTDIWDALVLVSGFALAVLVILAAMCLAQRAAYWAAGWIMGVRARNARRARWARREKDKKWTRTSC